MKNNHIYFKAKVLKDDKFSFKDVRYFFITFYIITICILVLKYDINSNLGYSKFTITKSHQRIQHSESRVGSSYYQIEHCKIRYRIDDKIYTKGYDCFLLMDSYGLLTYYKRLPSITWLGHQDSINFLWAILPSASLSGLFIIISLRFHLSKKRNKK
ncbi:MAG: hypothetical protein KIT33_06965 [Candidatus Kapabacteria bacterium]|nr:hypothetical protein [Ignavibacteriota bacterium]MCW5884696.1 hypothetical protein [Candidatus Kapabacteria bacterium]